jgi:hypothetical protein
MRVCPVDARASYVYAHGMKMRITPIAVGAIFILFMPMLVIANHKAEVGGKTIIDSSDPGIKGVDDGCNSIHYHGTLNGVADPATHGCGHGVVTVIPHGDGDGETIPPPLPKGPSFPARVWAWLGSWFTAEQKETMVNVVNVTAEANGVAPPGTVSDTVDIVKDATPSIKEKIDVIDEYRETTPEGEDTLGIYNKPSSGGNADGSDTLSQKFFKWFDGLIK